MNKVTLIGNLVADPQTTVVDGGYSLTTFTVACNRKHGDVADFFRVSVWGNFGQTCQDCLSKGKKVYLEGTLSPKAYIGNDGTPRIALDITATTVEFLSPRDKHTSAPEEAKGAPVSSWDDILGDSTSPFED